METSGLVMGAAGPVVVAPVLRLVTSAAARGDLDVNGAVGIKTRLTRSSQAAWQVAHRAALPWMTGAALVAVTAAVLAVVALVLARTDGLSAGVPAVVLAAGYVAMLVLIVVATRAGHRAVRAAGLA